MSRENRQEQQRTARNVRKPPGKRPDVLVRFRGDGELAVDGEVRPGSLILEATNCDGDTAPWFQDYWWTQLIDCFANEPLVIHIAPTLRAVMHADVRHQVEMVRRVAPAWRVIGHVHRTDLHGPDDLRTLALSGFDEIRVIDAEGRPSPDERMREDLSAAQIIAGIREEQQQVGTTRPILVRVPASAALKISSPDAESQRAPSAGTSTTEELKERDPIAERCAGTQTVRQEASRSSTAR
ncbi:MAG: hypothetical protein J5J06_03245 [Phycisphaerae bacterium]|nr:hypothetical protein [Phycisphaerae bacterium]